MNKKLYQFLAFIGIIGLLFSCEKDETKVIMLANPIVPTIQTVPDLTLKRANGTDTLVFTGTALDPGFQVSANYILEACAKGNNFTDAVAIKSGFKANTFKITVSDLNGLMLKKFPADQVSAIDLRIRAVLALDAGTGATPLVYNSDIKSANLTVYGLPRLDIVNSGLTQKIESPLGNGQYSGYVKLDKTKAFTLKDPDKNVVYGATGSGLVVNGSGITAAESGWYKLTSDTKALTFKLEAYMIGLVGDATPNGWNSPDSKMDYNAAQDYWFITVNLTNAQFKFRLNDGWATNWGGKGSGDGTADNYLNPTTVPLSAGGKNIGLPGGAGNYTIKLYISDLKATVVKN